MRGTLMRSPSRSGAFRSASSTGRQGSGTSSRTTFARAIAYAVGGTSSGGDLADPSGVLEDHAELDLETRRLLVRQLQSRQTRDVLDVDVDGHGAEV
jgi:hypothetical protein